MLATRITTHAADAVSRLVSQYKGSPRVAGLVDALMGEVQLLEDAIYDLDAARSLFGHPEGAQLDKLGELIGVERNGLSDATYLSVLRGAISENNSDGTSATVVRAAANLFQAQAIFRKDVSSIGPWPGLVAEGGSAPIPYVIPEDAITVVTGEDIISDDDMSSVYIVDSSVIPADDFGSGKYVIDPGGTWQESFNGYLTFGGVILQRATFEGNFHNSHPTGTTVMWLPLGSPTPGPTPGTPPSLATRAMAGEGISGAIALGLGSPHIAEDDYPVVQAMLLGSLPAGVGVFYISTFNANGAFACAGPQAWVGGWGDVSDPTIGAPMANLLYNNPAL